MAQETPALIEYLPYILSALGLLGSAAAGFFTYREHRARQASDITRTHAEASNAEASATQRINEAAAVAVDTLRNVHEAMREEMDSELQEARENIDKLAAESAACVERNRILMQRNATLEGRNAELERLVIELREQNVALAKKVDQLQQRVDELEQFVDKHIGLTDIDQKLE